MLVCVCECVLCVCVWGGGDTHTQALSVSTSGGSNGISMSRTTRATVSTSLLDILKSFNGYPSCAGAGGYFPRDNAAGV